MSEQLIMLLIFGAVAAISTWINKKRQEREEREQGLPPPPSPGSGAPPPRRSISWEEEMRRLLEGAAPVSPPAEQPAPPAAPRPVRPTAGRPVSPPIIVSSPSIPSWTTPRSGPSAADLLEQAQRRREEAQQQKAQAQEQLRTVLVKSSVSPSAAHLTANRVRRQLSDRASLQSAFVVSLVFGPPKALADPQGP